MRRRAPEDTSDRSPSGKRARGERASALARFEYEGAMKMLDDDFRGGVLATCAFAREKTAYGDVARMMDAGAGGGRARGGDR